MYPYSSSMQESTPDQQATQAEKTMTAAKKMTKEELIDLLTLFAHTANAMQLDFDRDGEITEKTMGQFWDAIDQLPTDIKESVIS